MFENQSTSAKIERMSGKKSGFTIIEVTLFLAITGLMLTGLLVGMGSNVSRRRYDDSVNRLTSLLQAQYDLVANPQNSLTGNQTCMSNNQAAGGRHSCLIYGRLVEFLREGQDVRVSLVVGNDTTLRTGDIDVFGEANLTKSDLIQETHTLEWGANLQQPGGTAYSTGFLLIVRSPINGSVRTFIPMDGGNGTPLSGAVLTSYITQDNLNQGRDICIASPDAPSGNLRAIRIAPDGSNPSAIQILPADTTGGIQC